MRFIKHTDGLNNFHRNGMFLVLRQELRCSEEKYVHHQMECLRGYDGEELSWDWRQKLRTVQMNFLIGIKRPKNQAKGNASDRNLESYTPILDYL